MARYGVCMLSGIKIFSSDDVWRRILAELGAEIVDAAGVMDVDFDTVAPTAVVTPMELKAIVLGAAGGDDIVRRVCGNGVTLAPGPARIVVALYRSGGARAADLKIALGYSRDATTHAIEAAIYQLRRQFGADFIVNDGGVYRLGKL